MNIPTKYFRPRNTHGQFRSVSAAIQDVQWEPKDPLNIDPVEDFLGTGTLIIVFQERGTYRYYDANYLDYQNLKNAASMGGYFNDNLRNYLTNYERIA